MGIAGRKRRAGKIAGLCLLGVGLAILAIWSFSARVPTVHLADGSTLRLECVRVQSEDGKRRPLAWMREAGQWLARKLGRPTFRRNFVPPGSLVYWISRREKGTGKPLDFGWLSHAVAVDSHGCRFDSPLPMMIQNQNWGAGGRPLPAPPAGSKYILVSGVLPAFPRREKAFRLELYDFNGALAAEMEIPNPAYRQYRVWKPETLPATRVDDDLTVTLIGVSNRWTFSPHDELKLKHFSLTPEFEFSTDWELADCSVEDATGNRGFIGPLFHSVFRPFDRFSLVGAVLGLRSERLLPVNFQLCTREAAWKVRATFFQTHLARFAPEEIWTIENLEIPAPGSARILRGSNTWQGVSVRLCAAAGPGAVTYSNGVPVRVALGTGRHGVGTSGRTAGGILVSEMSIETGKPQVVVQVSRLREKTRFQAIARAGESIYPCSESAYCNDYKLIELDVPEGARSVDLTFVVQRPRVVEFLVQPHVPGME